MARGYDEEVAEEQFVADLGEAVLADDDPGSGRMVVRGVWSFAEFGLTREDRVWWCAWMTVRGSR